MENYPQKLNFTSPEAEIAFLREQIANKEQELREKKVSFNTDEVVKEQINKYKELIYDLREYRTIRL
jgi:hypothetical protein